MNNKHFCHLHSHTEYSTLDGVGSCEDYAKKAKELGFKYLAITDHGNIDGIIKFQNSCEKYNIKPILGCEAYIVPDAKIKEKEKRGHITLLIKNQIGFNNLCHLLNYANIDGFYHKPRIDYKTMLEYCDGLVIMTACVSSFLTLSNGEEFFWDLDEKITDDLYLEVMPHDMKIQKEVNQICLDIHRKYQDIKLVGSNDCHYIDYNDDIAQDVLLAINQKKTWNDSKRFSFDFRGLHLKTANEMIDEFKKQDQLTQKEIHNCIKNTIEIAKKCSDFRIKQKIISLPKIQLVKNETSLTTLKKICKKSFRKKFGVKISENKIYKKRYLRELDLIDKKGFIDYFLIVYELIDWCHKNDIMIGPRGSVGGSLIAFLMDITNLDPIKYNLLFERFIDEERKDYPDIDIDFEDIRRPEIRQHLEDLYGKNNIAGVNTFIRMTGKACVRDISRVFEIPMKEVNKFCNVIDKDIKTAIETTQEGIEFYKKYQNEVDIMYKLEGKIKTGGQHAAALILSHSDLTKGVSCNLIKRKDSLLVNWEKEDAEFMGLMKLDALSLNTLTILNNTKKLIKENNKKFMYHAGTNCYFIPDENECYDGSIEIDFDFDKIPLDDKDVLKMLSIGKVSGIFQMAGYMAAQVAKELKINSFKDIISVMALGRPGPYNSGMTKEFIKRKHSRKWKKINKIYEDVLKDTYGLIVYQEDVMFVINKVAGLSFATADKIRKIISKKRDVKEFEQYKIQFIEGCLKRKTLSEKQANEVWKGFLKWCEYGFNKAHSTAYATIAYWCAYCKYHFTTEFICANLTYGKKKIKEKLIEEAYGIGLEVVLPRIGVSHISKWVAKDDKLYCPFLEIKDIGEKTAIKLINTKPKKEKVNLGFFKNKKNARPIKQSKIEKIIYDINADGSRNDIDIDVAQKYFSFPIF